MATFPSPRRRSAPGGEEDQRICGEDPTHIYGHGGGEDPTDIYIFKAENGRQ
jgi:hypothetical protein